MPHKIFVVMGQGVAGDLRKVSFCTYELLTCAGIAMHRSLNDRGGLFHYPAGGLTDPDEDLYKETSDSLKQMLGYIWPDTILIVTAANAMGGVGGAAEEGMGGGTSQRDKSAMVNWFDQLGFRAQLSAESGWAGLSSRGVFTSTTHVNWPGGDLHDWQGKAAGVYPCNGANVTLVGKSRESNRVDPEG